MTYPYQCKLYSYLVPFFCVLFRYIFSYLFMNSFIYLSLFFLLNLSLLFWEAKVLFVVITVIFMHLVLLLSDSCFGQRQEESFPSATKVNVCPVGYEHVWRLPPTRRANTWSNISRMRLIVSPPDETLRRELKYDAHRCIFDDLQSVSSGDETLCRMPNITSQTKWF